MTNKKIFLCFVNSSEDKGYHNFTIGGCSEHLGLGYLSSFLKENHYRSKIFIIDTLIQKHNLLKEIKEKEPLLVGFSIVNKNLNASIDLAKTIKAIAPGCHITFGGHLATLAGESILSDCSFVDSIVKGYGEETLLCLAKHLINKKNLFSIRGLLFRSKTKLINNLPRKVTRNIDRYPLPDRSYLKEHIIKGDFPSARLVSSRGCYYRCKYCSTPPFLDNQKCNKRWIPRSPQNVVAEIEYLKKKYDIKVIVFNDDLFLSKSNETQKRANQIADQLINKNLNVQFWAMCRADAFENKKNAEELVKKLKLAGLCGIVLGLESGTNSQLKAYGKTTNIVQNLNAVRTLKKYNVMIECGFIMFYPKVEFAELLKNAEFLNAIQEAHIFRYFCDGLELFPGIYFINELINQGLIKGDQYQSITNYPFADKRIQSLFLFLQTAKEKMRFYDKVLWDIQKLINILQDLIPQLKMQNYGQNRLLILQNLVQDLKKKLKETGQINYECFISYIEEAIKNNNTKCQEYFNNQMLNIYSCLLQIIPLIEKLKNIKNSFPENIYSYLIEWFFKKSNAINFYRDNRIKKIKNGHRRTA